MGTFQPGLFDGVSNEDVNKLWDAVVASGHIIEGDDIAHVDKRKILELTYRWKKAGVFSPRVIPKPDSEFKAICDQYREDWEKHKATKMIITKQTFTTKPIRKVT